MKKSITTLDLNLLLCLQLLMQERSVTKAAKRMNVTPSAVSKSLALIMFVAPGRPVAAHEEIHHHA